MGNARRRSFHFPPLAGEGSTSMGTSRGYAFVDDDEDEDEEVEEEEREWCGRCVCLRGEAGEWG
jgi:hypothetical protein